MNTNNNKSADTKKLDPNKKYSDMRCWLVGLVIVGALCAFSMIYMDNMATTDPSARELYQLLKVVLLSTLLFAGVFAVSFTSPPTTFAMRILFITAYAFSLTSIFFPLALIMWVGKGEVQQKMIYSPVGIVHACALDISGSGKSIPEEIRCPQQSAPQDTTGNQWVVQLGGTVQPVGDSQIQLLPAMITAADGRAIVLNPANIEPENRKICTQPATDDADMRDCYIYDPHIVKRRGAEYRIATRNLIQDEQGSYWLRVSHEDYGDAKFIVYGGIVVPLYVLIIAQLGGIIGLMRRVPELQREYWEGRQQMIKTINDPAVIDESQIGFSIAYRIRGCIIFQIMQVISAPLIALVAFHLFSPSSTLSSVALAFVCGFASEAILVKIRDMNDSLMKSVSGKPQAPDTESGEPKPKEQTPEETAPVEAKPEDTKK
ncbi:hypothetical protein WKI13_01660 [Teredinibacter turnerae]|uniref:hypothetical protein n=1 Tax=Teredinibacter turnerae TaxID=2426 RepID=UPI0003763CD0|nr:hypothetical protein [Teredinibacter turnerae]